MHEYIQFANIIIKFDVIKIFLHIYNRQIAIVI